MTEMMSLIWYLFEKAGRVGGAQIVYQQRGGHHYEQSGGMNPSLEGTHELLDALCVCY